MNITKQKLISCFRVVLDENLQFLVNEREDDEIDLEKSSGDKTDFLSEIQTLVQSDSRNFMSDESEGFL